MTNFSQEDLQQIENQGQTYESIQRQLHYFEVGFPFLALEAPATKENGGILSFTAKESDELVSFYEKQSAQYQIVKFVPASGAASRMFKDLFAYCDEGVASPAVDEVLEKIDHFAFFDTLNERCREQHIHLDQPLSEEEKRRVISLILKSEGLNYGQLPKGLIAFHRYGDGVRLAMEEHLAEGAMYARNSNNEVAIHFTVSPEHQTLFQNALHQSLPAMEERFGVRYHVTFSVQKQSTDTIAVNPDNSPFRQADGSLLFRPAGHGALIENLNELPQEIVFVKNIDNVVPDPLKTETVYHKKVLGGLLLKTQQEVHAALRLLKTHPAEGIEAAKTVIQKTLHRTLPDSFATQTEQAQVDYLQKQLHRPLRVCGMVKNEGEPGGGPFYVKDGTLQIVESSQVNKNDPQQQAIMQAATHFNPVDLVCFTKDFEGNAFPLLAFVDPETGFISQKSKDGKPLKAQELPGLWNGAMAHWLTLFVEVPLITFNPVKTVNDLLRREHGG